MVEPEDASGLALYEVSKAFGSFSALKDFSLRVRQGEVVALFGPNGAGKTTLLRVAAGITRPDKGRVVAGGADMAKAPLLAKRAIGWAAERPLLYGELTPLENLEFFGRLYGVPAPKARATALRLLEEFGLAHRAQDASDTLSFGMQQRVSLARALVHGPRVLLLDEPFEGLDVGAQSALIERLREAGAREGRATLLATHQIELGLTACDRVALIDEGGLVRVVPRGEADALALARELQSRGGGPRAG